MGSIGLCKGLWLPLAGLLLATTACDPMRPGTFHGDSPKPSRINLPQSAGFAVAAEQSRSVAQLSLALYRLWPTRDWTYANEPFFTLGRPLPSQVDYPVWTRMVDLMDSNLWDYYDITAGGQVLAATVYSEILSPSSPTEAMIAADIDHVLLVSTIDTQVQPIGPSGPTLHVLPGFHMYERSCTPDGQERFDEVSVDSALDVVEIGWRTVPLGFREMPTTLPDYSVVKCGIDTSAPIDLGTVAAPLPGRAPDTEVAVAGLRPQVTAFAWSPGGDGIFLLVKSVYTRGYIGSAYPVNTVQLAHLTVGESAATTLLTDDFAPPLVVPAGGTSVLVGHRSGNEWSYIQQSLSSAATPEQNWLPWHDYKDPKVPPQTALSPDGNVLALEYLEFVDLRSLKRTSFALPLPDTGSLLPSPAYARVPHAWSPDGKSVLLEFWDWSAPPYTRFFAILPLEIGDGLPTGVGELTLLPSDSIPPMLTSGYLYDAYALADTQVKYFWSASGPQVLIQDASGARVYNFVTQQTVALVEANRAAPPAAAVDAVASTDQAFAWSVRCYGMGENMCQAELRRLSLATGAVDTVATADRPRIFAVSSDGRQIVFADDDSIYLKTIVP